MSLIPSKCRCFNPAFVEQCDYEFCYSPWMCRSSFLNHSLIDWTGALRSKVPCWVFCIVRCTNHSVACLAYPDQMHFSVLWYLYEVVLCKLHQYLRSLRKIKSQRELEIIWVLGSTEKKHTSERVETDWTSCNKASDELTASFRISNACRKNMYF